MKVRTTLNIQGTGVSPGIAIGRCYILDRAKIHVSRRTIEPGRVLEEQDRLRIAIDESKGQLLEIRQKIDHPTSAGSRREHVLIIDAHLAILDDELFTEAALKRIAKERVNAEYALSQVITEMRKVFDEIPDPYLRERGTDIDYIGERILRNLVGQRLERISDIATEVVIVAHDLSPADTAQMNKTKVLGFVTAIGGPTGHTAIVARSLEIPAVVGLEDIFADISDGDGIIVDGSTGTVILRPDPWTTEHFIRLREEYEEADRELHAEIHLPSETRDGHRVILSANLEILEELPLLKKHGAEGVGLYRTEYIFLDRDTLPTEEEHFESYSRIVEGVSPHTTTIRTLDLGGDKFNHVLPIAAEMNPAMGLRAIRFCLKEPAIFRTQLHAILRASAFGPVRIMFPMISGIAELRTAKKHLEEVKAELAEKKIPFDKNIKVGSMIEIPSASIMADRLAGLVDFFSIGTNDLIQYTLAIDRVNEHVSYLYEPLHPAVLRIVRNISEAGQKAGIEVAMCGEMAGTPLYIPLLVGLGINALSMTAQSVPRAKKILRAISLKEAEKLVEHAFTLDTAAEIDAYLREVIRKKWPQAFPRDLIEEHLTKNSGT